MKTLKLKTPLGAMLVGVVLVISSSASLASRWQPDHRDGYQKHHQQGQWRHARQHDRNMHQRHDSQRYDSRRHHAPQRAWRQSNRQHAVHQNRHSRHYSSHRPQRHLNRHSSHHSQRHSDRRDLLGAVAVGGLVAWALTHY